MGEYCQSKSPELTVKGRVIYIGSYKLCLEIYSQCAAALFGEVIDNGLSSIGTPLLWWCPKKVAGSATYRHTLHLYEMWRYNIKLT